MGVVSGIGPRAAWGQATGSDSDTTTKSGRGDGRTVAGRRPGGLG